MRTDAGAFVYRRVWRLFHVVRFSQNPNPDRCCHRAFRPDDMPSALL